MSSGRTKSARSLRDFAMGKNREACRVCALPASVREQIRTRNTRSIKVADVLAWLKAEYGVTVTPAQYTQHANGRHEVPRR